MKRLLFIIFFLPQLVTAQKERGIQFEQGSSWQEIKEKAKAANKLIFVDCYATWCGPCRFMSDSIFTQKRTGDTVNQKFISVQVQMDTSKKDNDEIKRWYKDAGYLMEAYQVNGFPTYLFFSPDGEIIHKDVGAKGTKDFLAVIAAAADPQKQYYTLLKAFRKGSKDYHKMPYLATKSKELGYEKLAGEIAREYINGYLEKLNDDAFCTKEHLAFIGTFYETLTSNSQAFRLYYDHPAQADSVMEMPGYARSFADYIITREEVTPYVNNAEKAHAKPNWEKITSAIRSKYNMTYAIRIVTNARVLWYKRKKDWENYTKYLVQKMENENIKDLPADVNSIVLLNNSAWEVFQHSNSKEELQRALNWINSAIPMDPQHPAGMLDTKANILYKLGRKEEAIMTQEKAIELEPEAQEMKATLKKMKQGTPTWPLYN